MKLTKILDYLEELQKLYPQVRSDDLKRIVKYGWDKIYLSNSSGGDINICDKKYKCFIGKLPKNNLVAFQYYAKKLSKKIRTMYKKRNISWDGYFYFGLTKNLFQEYLNQYKNPHIKYITFKNVVMYKVFEECKISERTQQYFFRIKWPYQTRNFTYYFESLKTKDAELIMTRDPLKFKDILVSNNKFKYL